MQTERIPVFAVLGHPNEGKSSVVSTLAENDSVPISPTPGETRRCHEYPVVIDGTEVIRFVDTPGFQSPRATLNWILAYSGPEAHWIAEFLQAHCDDPDFADECELMTPLADGAGIIFVVDGSRPVRKTDQMEMDILRHTGLPRMAVINTKERRHGQYLEDWKHTARKHFNTIRIFDAHRASFAERMDLLDSLKGIDPDWQAPLQNVIGAFAADWRQRMDESAAIVGDLLKSTLGHTARKTVRESLKTAEARNALMARYQDDVAKMEKQAHQRIKKRFKHNIFAYDLPPQSMVNADLFSTKTWRALGLTRNQMAWTGAGIGAGIGAKVDLALAGLTFGVFTAIGSALGAGSAAWGTRKIAKSKIKGQPLGGIQITIGPIQNDQLLYVLVDRALIYFWHVINWTHSRRDRPGIDRKGDSAISPFLTANWTDEQRRISKRFFKSARKKDPVETESAAATFSRMLAEILKRISQT